MQESPEDPEISHEDPQSATSTQWLSYAQAAQRLGVEEHVVKRMVRDGELLASAREDGRRIPAAFIHNGATSRYLRGVINVLRDGGYGDEESVNWLLREDESLGACPAVAMHHNLHREVSRRAQALAF